MNEFVLPPVGAVLTPAQAMKLAIAEAYKGAARVSPNPLVGAVVVDAQGGFIQAGHHEFYGGPHAEVNALKNLEVEQLRDATVYVSLEPCAHEGKTPSCAKMLAQLPLKKVIFGLIDPNPLVAGQGAEILRKAAIEAEEFSPHHAGSEYDSIKRELEKVCEAFLWNFKNKKVFVGLKLATSIDGKLGLHQGPSGWITGEESRKHVHYLRSCYDAICVGKETFKRDNPQLNVRYGYEKKLKVFILDTKGESYSLFSQSALAKAHEGAQVYWVVGAQFQQQIRSYTGGPQIVAVETENGQVSVEAALAEMHRLGVRSLFVEGGGRVAEQFLMQGLVNRLYVFVAPQIMGKGVTWTEALHLSTQDQKIHVQNPQWTSFGPDMLLTGTLEAKRRPRIMTENHFQELKWVRSSDGIFLGVCKGLAQSTGMSAGVMRALWLLAIFGLGTGVLFYFILGLCLPREDKIPEALSGKVLGVCAKIAKRYRIEVGIVRLSFVLTAFFTFGVSILVYGLAYFIVDEPST